MLKKIFCLFFFAGISNALFAQSGREGTLPVARASEKGVWIYLGNVVPKNFSYTVERKIQNTNRYETLGKASLVKSLNELEALNQKWSPSFSKLDMLSQNEVQLIWNYLQKNKTTDSLVSDNLPVMHLLAGTAFLDTKVRNNQSYIYRITAFDENGNPKGTQETPPVTWPASPQMPAVQFFQNRYADGKMIVEWKTKELKDLAHFNVYRTVFGKDEFDKIKVEKGFYNNNDSLVLLAIDTIGRQPVWYEYEIEPVDIYGNAGARGGLCAGGSLSGNYVPPAGYLKAVGLKENHQIKLTWRYENKKYLTGISIMRSMRYDAGYQRIATVQATDTSYVDIVPESGENFYYYLLLNSAGEEAMPTAKVFATYTNNNIKPGPPNEIDAVKAPEGIRIYWKNEEPFINGFFVYRRMNTTEPFVQVSSLIPAGEVVNSFTDTSRQLQGGEVYEYVVRSRNEDNQLSANSDTVSATPGVKTALTSPVNLRFRSEDDRITIIWDDMQAWEPDLLGYKVYRKAGDESFVKMNNDSLQPSKNFYVDSAVQSGIHYSYAVSGYDISGNESAKATIEGLAISENLPATPSGIQLSITDNAVYITWGQIAGEVSAINIYRFTAGQQPKLIATVDDADSYTDKNVSKGTLYFYQLSSVNKDRKEGTLSDKVAVRMR